MKWASLVIVLAVATAAIAFARLWSPGYVVEDHRLRLRGVIVDHTVGRDYEKHRGATWLFQHLGIRTAGGDVHTLAHYVGAVPGAKNRSTRLLPSDLTAVDAVYIADGHGSRATSPDNRLGLLPQEASLLRSFAEAGGRAVVEFNTFHPPAHKDTRAAMEALLGVRTTGWVGRVFPRPAGDGDLPAWLLKEWQSQYPTQPPDDRPTLVLHHRLRGLRVIPGASLKAVTPHVEGTQLAKERFGIWGRRAPYFGWFALIQTDGSTPLATITVPHPDAQRVLASEGFHSLPFAVSRDVGDGAVMYLAGDALDTDFDLPDPGASHAGQLAFLNERSLPGGVSREPMFWRISVPLISQWLRTPRAPRD